MRRSPPVGAALSVPTATVPRMEPDDVVDPIDAAFQALLVHAAAETTDDEKRDKLIDGILTLPQVTEWPPESQENLWETCRFIKDLAREARRKRGNAT